MDKSAYDRINEFCTSQKDIVLLQPERDYVLRKFLDSYYTAMENHKTQTGNEPTQEEIQTILTSLLNKNTLSSYVDSANKYYKDFIENKENDFKKQHNRSSFWKNVLGSVLANLLYSIILIIIFYVAKDQISSWLTQLWN